MISGTISPNYSDEGDLYEFQDYPPPPEYGEDGGYFADEYASPAAPKNATSRLATAAIRKGTAVGGRMGASRAGRPGAAEDQSRPMTSVGAAGYRSESSLAKAGRGGIMESINATRTPVPTIQKKKEEGPEEIAKELEKEVNTFLEESAIAHSKGNQQTALEKAKEAAKRERKLTKFRDANNMGELQNVDLTYAVIFNLAHQYHQTGMYQEALNTYQVLVKNKSFTNAGRLRVNMGNIYYEQKKYPSAIKMYRMALDQTPTSAKMLRSKLLRNLGNAMVRQGQFQDAIQSFESIMEDSPDYKSGMNLVICYYALGDRDQMRKSFQALVSIRKPQQSDLEDNDEALDDAIEGDAPNDSLKAELRDRQKMMDHSIIMAGQLIAPAVEKDIPSGYDWVVECLRSSNCNDLANEMEIAKALNYMKHKDFEKAIETLKAFEKKDQKMVGTASTNLSFLYFLERNYNSAEKYADYAINVDKYNAKALVNKGNCFAVKNDLEGAKSMYQEALKGEADCVEAIFNLGLVCKKLDQYDKALQQFSKLQSMIPHHPEVEFQIATLYEKLDDTANAMRHMRQLVALVQTDPGILAKLGSLYAEEDEAQAFQYHLDSYRYYPVNLNVISWLGVYYVKNEVYEKAIHYFQRASQLQPNEVKWQLMVGSCHRRMGAYQQALELYKKVHAQAPENIECIRYLVNICNDLGLKDEMHEYLSKLRKLQKNDDSENDHSQQTKPAYENPSTDLSNVQNDGNSAKGMKSKRVEDEEFDDDAGGELLPL